MKTIRNSDIGRFLTALFLISVMAGSKTSMANESVEIAVFAGGCFWCTEHDFDQVEGVISTTSGYIGGHTVDPTYQEISAGGTGHTEAVRIVFDHTRISYEKLLDIFWRSIDPTVENRQFCDQGNQYRSGIFYQNDQQKKLALASKEKLEKNKPFQAKIVTEITEGSEFYLAEKYHQDFHEKNPIRYKLYRFSCGRDQRLEALWGDFQQLSGG
ncbi:Peptide-methionine (S)-S-oxide reductase MsrA [hydrothermal vent metagenome]|uniref:peptide-methionine (S)-S-oxide reductase n=1 Tax=hydrothermal vent metagenome TaxID=652676 RepID=A0A3B1CMX6_9ZZZZ